MRMSFRISAPVVVLGLLGLAVPVESAYLYWHRVRVRTASEAGCISMAHAVASRNLTNVRRSALEVAGSAPGAYAAITCIATPQRAMAVVMVTGDSDAPVRAMRDKLSRDIQAMTPID